MTRTAHNSQLIKGTARLDQAAIDAAKAEDIWEIRAGVVWTRMLLPEAAQCVVCRGFMEPRQPVHVSPGQWVKHLECKWK